MRKRESKLTSAYYDIKGVGSFGGIEALAKKTKVKRNKLKSGWKVKMPTLSTNRSITGFPEERLLWVVLISNGKQTW